MAMKKMILVLLLLAGFQQLRAQQLLQFNPDCKLLDSLNNFKPQNSNSLNQLLLHPDQLNPLNSLKLTGAGLNNIIMYSNMPVAKLQGYDPMPIAKLGEPGMKYTMLVKKVTVMRPGDQVAALAP